VLAAKAANKKSPQYRVKGLRGCRFSSTYLRAMLPNRDVFIVMRKHIAKSKDSP
jgi:hypothetical protein